MEVSATRFTKRILRKFGSPQVESEKIEKTEAPI